MSTTKTATAKVTARKGRTTTQPTVKTAPYAGDNQNVLNLHTWTVKELKEECETEGLAKSGTKSQLVSRLTGLTVEQVQAIVDTAKATNAKTPKPGTGAAAKMQLAALKRENPHAVQGSVSKLTADEAKATLASVRAGQTAILEKKLPKVGTRDFNIALIRGFNNMNPHIAVKGFSTMKAADAKEKCLTLGLIGKDGTVSDLGKKLIGIA